MDKVPAFSVGEGGIGGPVKLVGEVDDLPIKIDGTGGENLGGRWGTEPEVKMINSLPHFARNILANSAGIFPSGGDTGADGVGIFLGESEEFTNGFGIGGGVECIEKVAIFVGGKNRIPVG